ncbi:hypothetical protein D9Q98_004887 [Chlorella vulgaris]|uniref:Mitochondrial fission 1 protein n=1 Tax=Chlorella vulgaris TaxID=3077 RepID=A0A9D4TN86_CHLVU|nr:hypothetical protein D9Q98_004887 [Chlorella vulgaris]
MAAGAQPFYSVSVPNWRGLLPARKEGDVERGMGDLPYTEAELIRQCQREYETAAEHGGQDALDACFRLAWALVHSRESSDVQRGIELAEALTDSPGLEQRDLLYLVAVGKVRQRKYIDARRTLKGLMQVHPEFRQAGSLLEVCDKEVLKDGMVGLGAGAAILGAVAAVAVAAMRK